MPEFITYIITNRYIVIGSILLACFVGYVAYLNFRLNEFNTASAKFRSAIIAELGTLYPIATNWPKNEDAFFKAAFPNMQAAVTEFRHFVPCYRRRAFDNAWLRYYCAYPERKEECYHHYMASFDPSVDTQEIATARRNKTFHANVSKLLSFAGNK
ncbi:hypothetical protein [Methylotenera mobilis]|uniref:hypothetical protein n=1 Tax=Methylotenera mobilis TaxID=359408 RepID=UPI00031D4A1F|nr:hypothetical protein [Methylotenera mobilis]